ncbi:MAG TPA: DegV family protein [Bacilli bacterium]|nr:DegV family protein [Bacilli bacterium]
MRKIKIITDSTCDIPPELIQKYDITIVPLYVSFGEETFADGVEITVPELFAKEKATGIMPKTSATGPEIFNQVFKKYIDEDYDIFYTGIGSGFSSTFQSATIARQEFTEGRIALVDSKNLSSGSGLLTLEAVRLREEGKTLSEIASSVEELVPNVRAQFIVDNLDYLYKGGRLSGAKFFFGRMLRAHPFIVVNDGKMDVAATPKGKIIRALDHQLDIFKKHLAEGIRPERVIITSVVAEEAEKYYFEELSKLVDPKTIVCSKAGSVIASHCGVGTIGILYIRKVKNGLDN